ncbi:hypothetical protein C5D09_15440 [Rathayibacter sp. AY1C9]|nr:hypothetical protein C5D09_15440 [Rathayibacter sp. AY1C9]
MASCELSAPIEARSTQAPSSAMSARPRPSGREPTMVAARAARSAVGRRSSSRTSKRAEPIASTAVPRPRASARRTSSASAAASGASTLTKNSTPSWSPRNVSPEAALASIRRASAVRWREPVGPVSRTARTTVWASRRSQRRSTASAKEARRVPPSAARSAARTSARRELPPARVEGPRRRRIAPTAASMSEYSAGVSGAGRSRGRRRVASRPRGSWTGNTPSRGASSRARAATSTRLEASSIVTGRSRAWASSSARSCRVIGGDPCGGPCRDPRGGSPPEAWPFQAHLARRIRCRPR